MLIFSRVLYLMFKSRLIYISRILILWMKFWLWPMTHQFSPQHELSRCFEQINSDNFNSQFSCRWIHPPSIPGWRTPSVWSPRFAATVARSANTKMLWQSTWEGFTLTLKLGQLNPSTWRKGQWSMPLNIPLKRYSSACVYLHISLIFFFKF